MAAVNVIVEPALPTENFSFDTLKELYTVCEEKVVIGNHVVSQFNEEKFKKVRDYIDHYFKALQEHKLIAMFHDGKWSVKTYEDVKNIYFNRMPKKVTQYFFFENTNLYSTIVDPHKAKIGYYYFNRFNGFIHPRRDYHTYPPDIKKKVELFNHFVLEVLSSGKQDVYQYNLKWFSNMAKGNKNKTLMYNRGYIQGVGKSHTTDFLADYVLGDEIALILNDVECLTSKNNSRLIGKLLIVFEEMPTVGKDQWMAVGSKIKHMVTGDTLSYGEMYQPQQQLRNISNYICITNNKALKESEGRRIFCNEISIKYLRNYAYFENLRRECFNKEVGEAYYNFLHTIDTNDFNSERDMPFTDIKLETILENLHIVYKFLKYEYILKKKNCKEKPKVLYSQFEEFCFEIGAANQKVNVLDFKDMLMQIGIKEIKDSTYYYKFKYTDLEELFKKNKWICDRDYQELKEQEQDQDEVDHLEDGIETIEATLKKKMKQLEEELEQLKKENERLKDIHKLQEETIEDRNYAIKALLNNKDQLKMRDEVKAMLEEAKKLTEKAIKKETKKETKKEVKKESNNSYTIDLTKKSEYMNHKELMKKPNNINIEGCIKGDSEKIKKEFDKLMEEAKKLPTTPNQKKPQEKKINYNNEADSIIQLF